MAVRGRKCRYPCKVRKPMVILLTRVGHEQVRAVRKATKLSYSECIEAVLRGDAIAPLARGSKDASGAGNVL